jgi:L-ascorbate metabolism protein UlaG (beta-lactamase superfamily)
VRERGVDVFLAGIAGRSFTEDDWRRILPLLEPRAVVPTHYDNFFRPLGERMDFVANVQLARLPEEIEAVSRDFELAALPRADRH